MEIFGIAQEHFESGSIHVLLYENKSFRTFAAFSSSSKILFDEALSVNLAEEGFRP